MTAIRRFALLLAIAAASVPCIANATRADKTLILIAGRPSHGPGEHEFRAGSLLLQKALADVSGLTVQVITNGWPTKMADGKTVDDDAQLENADAIVMYSDGGGGHPAIQGNRIAVIDRLAAKGVGLGFMHYAVEFPVGAPSEAMLRWTGGYYEDRYSVNPIWSPQYEKFATHPITRGVHPFSTRDEWYFSLKWTPDAAAKAKVTPLLVATPSDDVRDGPYVSPKGPYPHIMADNGKAETMMWAYERANGGRSFGFTGGHSHRNWGNVDQRRIVLNALLWIAKIDVPAGGVADRITEADLNANLDQKSAR